MNKKGFTLLEVIIAFSIITVVVLSAYTTQSYSLFNSSKTKNLSIATNLARTFIAKSELELEKESFTSLSESETGEFPKPFDKFKWTREVKEIDFSYLTELIALNSADADFIDDEPEDDSKKESVNDIILKVSQNFFKDSIRKVIITIQWKENDNDIKLKFNTFLVKYDAKIRTGN